MKNIRKVKSMNSVIISTRKAIGYRLLALGLSTMLGGCAVDDPVGSETINLQDTKIAFNKDRGNRWDIFLINPDGIGERFLVSYAWDPCWSPDGNWIVYVDDGWLEIVNILDADITRNAKVLEKSRFGDHHALGGPAWSPDGTTILFFADAGGNTDIFAIDPDDTHLVNITNSPENETDPAWSRDGSKIVYNRTKYDVTRLYVMNADGSDRKAVIFTYGFPAWSLDENIFTYFNDTGIYNVLPGAARDRCIVYPSEGYSMTGFSWAPTGNQLVYTNSSRVQGELIIYDTKDGTSRRISENITKKAHPAWSPVILKD
jgi:TolB protein